MNKSYGLLLLSLPFTAQCDFARESPIAPPSDNSHSRTAVADVTEADGWDFRGDYDALNHRPRDGAHYYVGTFVNSHPADGPDCGTRIAPCATLQYWNRSRRQVLQPGDTVRIAPGVYQAPGGTHHCILLDEMANGVTYEGRSVNDQALDDTLSATIDLLETSTDQFVRRNPCLGSAIRGGPTARKQRAYRDVIVRNLTFTNAPGTGIHIVGVSGAVPAKNFTLEKIKVTGSQNGGAMIGRFTNTYSPVDVDCRDGGRDVRNVRILNSEFAFNRGFPGGISLGCVDGVLIEDTSVHDACDLEDCGLCMVNDVYADKACNDRDGIGGSGAINVVIRNNEIHRVGEDGIDFGGHPYGKSHHIVVEGNAVYDNPRSNIKLSGARYALVRNNYTWGHGNGFHTYSCPHHVSVYHNTFMTDARGLMSWEYMNRSQIVNNIFYSTGSRRRDVNVWIDVATSNRSNFWDYNVIANRQRKRYAFGEFRGAATNLSGCEPCANSYEPPPLPCSSTPVAANANYPNARRPNTRAGRSHFYSETGRGLWFADGSAANDRWGVRALFVDEEKPTKANLRLTTKDSVARQAGGFFMQATSDGSGTTIEVIGLMGSDDPRTYFLSPHSFRGADGDEIQVTGAGSVTITDMTHSTISVEPAIDWKAGARIHLPWTGKAPDRGAIR